MLVKMKHPKTIRLRVVEQYSSISEDIVYRVYRKRFWGWNMLCTRNEKAEAILYAERLLKVLTYSPKVVWEGSGEVL